MTTISLRQKIFIGACGAVALIAGVGLSYRVFLMIYRKKYLAHTSFMHRIQRLVSDTLTSDNPSVLHLSIQKTCDVVGLVGEEPLAVSLRLLAQIEAKERATELQHNDPFLPPFAPGIYITDLGKTHRLLANRYSLADRHVLIVSRVFEPQCAELTDMDLAYSYIVALALDGFAFYNSDRLAGASQKHKHTQVVPHSSFTSAYLDALGSLVSRSEFTAEERRCGMKMLSFPPFAKYKHCLIRFEELDVVVQDLREFARVLKAVHVAALRAVGNDKAMQSHNLLWGRNWLLVVMRKKERLLDAASMNALGCIGSLLVKSERVFDELAVKSPEDIFDEVLVEFGDSNEYAVSIEM